jgi:type IV pilus assembly protein PilC
MLVQKGSIARFSRTLATLLGAGVRIIDCLDIAASTAGNWAIESALLKSKESIQRGRTIVEPLAKEPHIPNMVSQMIAIGEQTGNLDTMLNKIADFFEDEVETAAAALTSMIEPILMVFLGGVIAVLVLAMYLPIFNLASTVGG